MALTVEGYSHDFEAEQARMSNQTEDQRVWVKCKERLPPYRKNVLVFSGSFVTTGMRTHTDEEGDWWRVGCSYDWWRVGCSYDKHYKDVTHWMLMPEKPDEF